MGSLAADDDWPFGCPDSFTLANCASSTAVCTLWTPRTELARALHPLSYSVVGNLYTREGIGLLVRNVLANPRLRHLVLCGTDGSGAGLELVLLIKEGVTADSGLETTPAIDVRETFRHRVELHDYRGECDVHRLRQIVDGLRSVSTVGPPGRLHPELEEALPRPNAPFQAAA